MSVPVRRVAILGASGNALDILDIIEALGQVWSAVGVLDDSRAPGADFCGLPVLGLLRDAANTPGLERAEFINAIGSERTYRRKAEIIAATGLPDARFTTLVHPNAAVSRRATLGHGVCVGPGSAVAGQVSIGDHAWIGAGVILGHDAAIGTAATLAPGAIVAGGVRIGALAYIGSGAVVRPGITVGEGALIGMGAIVLHDVAPGSMVVGNPARPVEGRAKQHLASLPGVREAV